jgi:hypothetical protein
VRKDQVPQDAATTTYGGGRKLLYAVDSDGSYVGVQSSGWETEATATRHALEEISRQTDDAWSRAANGESSPLEYYMYYRRMDLALLAQTSGFWQWRIRRHFVPAVYAGLSDRVLDRYAEVLGINLSALRMLTREPGP